jgi:hypothetical protein
LQVHKQETMEGWMKRILTGIVAVALILAGLAGLVFAIAGVAAAGTVEQEVETRLMAQVDLADRALAATAEGLVAADDALTQAAAAAGGLEMLARGMGAAIDGTAPTLDAVAGMVGEQLPATIKVTQDTLATIVETTQVVDNLMAVVTSIPLLGLDRYEPEVPLSRGVMEVASSLDGIPQSLTLAQEGLLSASDGLVSVQSDVDGIASEVGQISGTLQDSRAIIEEYQVVVGDLRTMVTTMREGLPGWLAAARWSLTLMLVWLGIAQLGLITWGWELLARSREKRE